MLAGGLVEAKGVEMVESKIFEALELLASRVLAAPAII